MENHVMKVILVNGSPHPRGCTFTALKEVSNTLEGLGVATDMFWIGNKPLSGCLDCRKCVQRGVCVVNDKVNEFLAIAGDYDGYVFGSPVHWGAAGGAITSFMNRAFFADFCGNGGRFQHKPAACVVSARREGTTASLDQLHKYFSLMQMPIVTARYWNAVHGMTPEEVRQDREGMQNMRYLGRNMAWLLACLESGRKAAVPLPEQEPVTFTNFIQ